MLVVVSPSFPPPFCCFGFNLTWIYREKNKQIGSVPQNSVLILSFDVVGCLDSISVATCGKNTLVVGCYNLKARLQDLTARGGALLQKASSSTRVECTNAAPGAAYSCRWRLAPFLYPALAWSSILGTCWVWPRRESQSDCWVLRGKLL